MPGPPGELMTREKISSEPYQKSLADEDVAKLFLESEFQRKGNQQMIKRKFSAKSCSFLGSNRFRNYIQILHGKGQIKILTESSWLGQEPTFKSKPHVDDLPHSEKGTGIYASYYNRGRGVIRGGCLVFVWINMVCKQCRPSSGATECGV